MFVINIYKKVIYLFLLRELFIIFLFNYSLNLLFIEGLLICVFNVWFIWYVDKVDVVFVFYYFEIELWLYGINIFYVLYDLLFYFFYKVNFNLNNILFNKIKLD